MTAGSALKATPGGATTETRRTGSGGRFFDSANSRWMLKVQPGEFRVTDQPDEVLVTVLGSCVSACIRDPVTGFGGMNHFMLAEDKKGNWGAETMSTRFGNFAMEKLINELIKSGCPRDRMEIKLFGGGNVIESQQAVGTKNAEFALKYLAAEGLKCIAQDLGGDFPRRIEYHPATGKVVRRLLNRTEAQPIVHEEAEYSHSVSAKSPAGEITLFGKFGK